MRIDYKLILYGSPKKNIINDSSVFLKNMERSEFTEKIIIS